MQIVIYADGGITPQRAGAGVVIQDGRGDVILIGNRPLPPMTNMQAEYAGLILALELASKCRASAVEIRMDSEIVVNQMVGRFGVNSPRLKPLHVKACELARTLPQVTYTYLPRERNGLADALAAEAAAGRRWRMRGGPCSG
jgi:ribonuclease HI